MKKQPKYSIGQILMAPIMGEVRVIDVKEDLIDPAYPETDIVYKLEVITDMVVENEHFKAFKGHVYNRLERSIHYSGDQSMYLPIIRRFIDIEGRDVVIETVGWDHNNKPNDFELKVNGDLIYRFSL